MERTLNFAMVDPPRIRAATALDHATQSAQPGRTAVLGFLIFMCTATLVFGVGKLGRDIQSPFAAGDVQTNEDRAKSMVAGTETGDRAKQMDTDSDGLSDYDEKNIYGTSAFLADTDSDGQDDKAEVAAGKDPKCAEGKNCFRTGEIANPDAVVTPQTGLGDLVSGVPAQKVDVLNPPPDQLRQILQQTGVSAAQLQGLTDDQLLALYRQTISGSQEFAQQAAQLGAPIAPAPTSTVSSTGLVGNPETMTATEIRAELIRSGKVTAEQLAGFSDEKIRSVFLQVVSQQKSAGTTQNP